MSAYPYLAPSPEKQGTHAQFSLGQASFSTHADNDLLPLCTHYARFLLASLDKSCDKFSGFAQSSFGLGFSDSPVVFRPSSDFRLCQNMQGKFTHLFPRFLGINLCYRQIRIIRLFRSSNKAVFSRSFS